MRMVYLFFGLWLLGLANPPSPLICLTEMEVLVFYIPFYHKWRKNINKAKKACEQTLIWKIVGLNVKLGQKEAFAF